MSLITSTELAERIANNKRTYLEAASGLGGAPPAASSVDNQHSQTDKNEDENEEENEEELTREQVRERCIAASRRRQAHLDREAATTEAATAAAASTLAQVRSAAADAASRRWQEHKDKFGAAVAEAVAEAAAEEALLPKASTAAQVVEAATRIATLLGLEVSTTASKQEAQADDKEEEDDSGIVYDYSAAPAATSAKESKQEARRAEAEASAAQFRAMSTACTPTPTTTELIDKTREAMHSTFQLLHEISLCLGFIHWYYDLMDRSVLSSWMQRFDSYKDVMQVAAMNITRLCDMMHGQNVEVMAMRAHHMELTYHARWPMVVTKRFKGRLHLMRGSNGIRILYAKKFTDLGWIKNDEYDDTAAALAFQRLHEYMVALNAAVQVVRTIYERFCSIKNYADMERLYQHVMQDIPVLTVYGLPDMAWRMYYILSVFMNPNNSRQRWYTTAEMLRMNDKNTTEEKLVQNMVAKCADELSKKKNSDDDTDDDDDY